MAYIVNVKQKHHNVSEGTTGERKEEDGQVLYEFDAHNKDFADSVSFSWNYIQNHKDYFDVKQADS